MKRLAISSAVAALMAAGLAMAQNSPSQQSTYPSQSPPPSSSSSYPSSNTSSSTSTTHKSHKQQMKDCMDEQKTNNPNESKSDAKKYCKNQLENAPHE